MVPDYLPVSCDYVNNYDLFPKMYLTVCYHHVTYAFQSKSVEFQSTLYTFRVNLHSNVKELLDQNRCKI